jgi:hypothetical protein
VVSNHRIMAVRRRREVDGAGKSDMDIATGWNTRAIVVSRGDLPVNPCSRVLDLCQSSVMAEHR